MLVVCRQDGEQRDASSLQTGQRTTKCQLLTGNTENNEMPVPYTDKTENNEMLVLYRTGQRTTKC